jgi:hypothetical protein
MMNSAQKICTNSDLGSVTTSSFLPRAIDPDEALRFAIDDRDGFNLLFVTTEMLEGPQPFTPYWVFACADLATIKAMSRWVAVRRKHWPIWAEMARSMTPTEFDSYMRGLIAHEPAMHVGGTMVKHNPEELSVAFLHVLESGTETRAEEVIRHRFASAEAYEGFLTWLNSGENVLAAGELVQLAFREGTDALGQTLDHLASTKPLTRQQRRALERQRAH